MHLGILPQINRRQRPAENPRGTHQIPKPPMREQIRPVRAQRMHNNRQISGKSLGRGIRLGGGIVAGRDGTGGWFTK